MACEWYFDPAFDSLFTSHPNSGDDASASHTDVENGQKTQFDSTSNGQPSSSRGVMGLNSEVSAPFHHLDGAANTFDNYGEVHSVAGRDHLAIASDCAFLRGVMGSQFGISAPDNHPGPAIEPITGLKRDVFFTEPADDVLTPGPSGGSNQELPEDVIDPTLEWMGELDWANPGLTISSSSEDSADEAPMPIEELAVQQADSELAVEDSPSEASTSSEEEESSEGGSTPRQVSLGDLSFEDTLRLARMGYVEGLRFKSVEEARRYAERREEVEHDETLPTTMEHKRVLVAMLIWAVKDTTTCEDSGKTLDDFQKGKWTQEAIELTCWEMLEKMILRHVNGAALTADHARKATGAFRDRFESMMVALKGSKAICKHLLDPIYLLAVVDDPTAALRRVRANRKVNERKSNIISLGTQVLAHGGSSPNEQFETPQSTSGGGTKRPASGSGKGGPPAKRQKGRR